MLFREGRCFVIAEVAQAHDGSLGTAHAYIDAVAQAGADAVKFQTHIAAAESTPSEQWRVRFSPQDETRYEYWKRMEFTPPQWEGLRDHAIARNLTFLSSPFSMEAVALLDSLGVPAWKVGAGELTNLPMLEAIAATRKPVLLSSGLAGWSDLDRAVELVRERGAEAIPMQCTTQYPCPPEKLGLNLLDELRSRYRGKVGLSDHSGKIYAGLAAAVRGAEVVEVHVAFSRECFGPDVTSSLTTSELYQLVEGCRFIEKAFAHPVDKDAMADELAGLRFTFGKSWVATRDLPAGHIIQPADINLKKPGTGVPAARVGDLLSRRLRHPVTYDSLIMETDLE
ncbi:MAG: N-acetylneuraminate synthase family protein [Bryobacteraceae bacterium]|nr:N-acetylneuraminate synthase family protein [Bryobacteraceae bacterium]